MLPLMVHSWWRLRAKVHLWQCVVTIYEAPVSFSCKRTYRVRNISSYVAKVLFLCFSNFSPNQLIYFDMGLWVSCTLGFWKCFEKYIRPKIEKLLCQLLKCFSQSGKERPSCDVASMNTISLPLSCFCLEPEGTQQKVGRAEKTILGYLFCHHLGAHA